MQKSIRINLLRMLKGAGVFARVRDSDWRRKQLLILCYHSFAVDDENLWRPALFLPSARLRERFELLKQGGFNVLPLRDSVERLKANDMPPRSVVLTFDDGTYDFYKIVSPLLKEFGFPATVYQTTHYCTRRQPVFPIICSYLLWKGRDREIPPIPSLGIAQAVRLSDFSQREFALREIQDFAGREGLSTDDKNVLACQLAQNLGLDYQEILRKRILQLMTPEEVSELAAAGVSFELHTHRHRVPRNRELFIKEIQDNRGALAAMTGTTPAHFCYPSGDYDRVFLPWLREQGIVSATTCVPGLTSSSDEPLLLPRFIDTTGQTELEFESWLTGVGALISSARGATGLRKNLNKIPSRIPESQLQD